MRSLSTLPQDRKVIIAGLLVVFTTTWAVGLSMVIRDNHMADGDPMLSVQDLQLRFTGGYTSLLQAQVEGGMRQHLENGQQVALIASWARAGGGQQGYRQDVGALIGERCGRCHQPGGEASFRPLQTFVQVQAAVEERPRPSVSRQLLVTKVHLAGLGLLLGMSAWLFSAAGLTRRVRTLVISLAFAGLFLDFASWWLMRLDLSFGWGRVLGNALMSSMFLIMVTTVAVALVRSQSPAEQQEI
jgi:hypothetical protein